MYVHSKWKYPLKRPSQPAVRMLVCMFVSSQVYYLFIKTMTYPYDPLQDPTEMHLLRGEGASSPGAWFNLYIDNTLLNFYLRLLKMSFSS